MIIGRSDPVLESNFWLPVFRIPPAVRPPRPPSLPRASGRELRLPPAQLGLEPPFLTMVAQPDSGPALVIRAARPTLSRECWIYNETSGLLMQVDPALLEQILATPAMFTDASRPNPFERWLRK